VVGWPGASNETECRRGKTVPGPPRGKSVKKREKKKAGRQGKESSKKKRGRRGSGTAISLAKRGDPKGMNRALFQTKKNHREGRIKKD